MKVKIVEIKAVLRDLDKIKLELAKQNAVLKGIDRQVDTYFQLAEGKGRLKLREGEIENNLIHYNRPNQAESKLSEVTLYKPNEAETLKQVLENALGTKVVVDKKREIHFIRNIKIHIDKVKQLGEFVEIEAIDEKNEFTEFELREQCEQLMVDFGIEKKDLCKVSYSDMLLSISAR
ncbi:MAG: adenylate cyclase class 2 [Arenicella sp.]|jgi:adenylate cyclase class 2